MPLRPIPPSPQSMKAQLQAAQDQLQEAVNAVAGKRNLLEQELKELRLSQAASYVQGKGVVTRQLDPLSAQIQRKEEEYQQRLAELRKLEKQKQQFDQDLAHIDEILDSAD